MQVFFAKMDIRSYFGASTSHVSSSDSSDCESDSSPAESGSEPPSPSPTSPPPSKKRCSQSKKYRRYASTKRKYSKSWEKYFSWLYYDEDREGAFCKICKQSGKSLQYTGGVWVTKPFKNWKKAVEKMKAHAKSASHSRATEAMLAAKGAATHGSVVQQLQNIEAHKRAENRAAVKCLILLTHFLTKEHIAHSTKFEKLVDVVIRCGSQHLKVFLETAPRNAVYTSRVAVVEFIEALGTWVEESILKRLQKAPMYSLMADECTDINIVEELSVFCRWEEDGVPVECFLEIIPLKRANAETIYSSLMECLKDKNLQVGRIVGLGFDGAATFSGKKTGVQARIKKHTPHALFVHCHCHLLQLACVQAANKTPGINHVYTTLTTLWKHFHYSPKRAEGLKEIQSVLELPEMKVIKPSDTRWLAHERCVKAVKASYSAIVLTLASIYENSHEPEALGIHNALCKLSSIAAMYLLDFTLPQVAKLSKALQTEKLDLSVISSLVDATLQSLDDAVLPAANWVLELLDHVDDLKTSTGVTIDADKILSFQNTVGKPFVADLKANITSRFSSSSAVVSALSIFDPRKVPKLGSVALPTYGDESIEKLLAHYGEDKSAETVDGEETVKTALVSSEIRTEWKTFRQLLVKQPRDSTTSQLKELATNDMLKAMFPNLQTIASIGLSIPVSTASVERSFSQMKLIKTRLRNALSGNSLSHLMKIAIESPETLSEIDLEEIVHVWQRKSRRITV